MNDDAGFTGSGGTWITPALSQQQLVWSETKLEGPSRFAGGVKMPPVTEGYYRDIALLAMPTPAAEELGAADVRPPLVASNGATAKPGGFVKLSKPQPGRPAWVQVEFREPYAARSLNMLFVGRAWRGTVLVQTSDDGRQFRTVAEFALWQPGGTLEFPPATARCYRLVFSETDNDFEVGRVEFTPRCRIANFREKSGLGAHSPESKQAVAAPPEAIVARDRVIDLSAKLAEGGKLAWNVPPGKWTLLRLGHTSTGNHNLPALPAATGLECDKFSRKAMDVHFAGMLAKLLADVGPLAGKTFTMTHVDSWEVGFPNWTARFRAEFARRRGYDPLPWLPVATGRVLDSLEVSERFLWDMRQTIAELLAENYAGRLEELSRRHGLKLSIEAYGGMFNDLTYAGRADVPMAEFWTGKMVVAPPVKEMATAAHVYGKPIVAAEAFTTWSTEARWLNHPFQLKALGDSKFLRRDQPFRHPSLRLPAVAESVSGHDHGSVGRQLRTNGDLVGAVQAMA